MDTDAKETITQIKVKDEHHSFFVSVLLRIIKDQPLAIIGSIIVLILLIVGIFANFIAPHGYNDVVLADRLLSPSAAHIFGTDHLGRDIFSRMIYGAQISMYVGLSVPAISVILSTIIGSISGFVGGKTDMVIQRFIDAVMCFPSLIIMLTVIAVTGAGLIQVILVLGILGGIGGQVRVVRSAVLTIKGSIYVDAAKSIGSSDTSTILRHILPNIMAPIIIIFTTSMGSAILSEASLSFLGFGIPPPYPSWGGMLSREGRSYMTLAPWMVLWPGLALALVVWGINMLGDGLRDVLDPRLKGGRGGRFESKLSKDKVKFSQKKK